MAWFTRWAACLFVCAFSSVAAANADVPTQPLWVIDPSSPGDDLPPVGRSLFDHLMTVQHNGTWVYEIPTSFAQLRQRIESQLQRDSAATMPGLKQVLVPLGRSLQRMAAAPDFFDSPRIVLAVDEGPAAVPGKTVMLLKDRLYLGYQSRSNVLEVISYNEAAGRFEFQLLKDFRPGGTPKLVYASRQLCMSCHQNGGPLFSRPTWDETNANPKVAALLDASSREFQGIAANRGVDVPNAIDDATDRANLLGAYQLLWREGCGDNKHDAPECRAALFVAALQFRLSGLRQFDRTSINDREHGLGKLQANARTRWPAGLAIPNPDIPNRDPLPSEAAQRDLTMLANVSARFDPLALRPPLNVWRFDDASTVDRIIAGLADFISDADIARLDKRLDELARGARPTRQIFASPCSVMQRRASPSIEHVDFDCGEREPDALRLRARVNISAGVAQSGRLNRLQLGKHGELREIEFATARSVTIGGERRLRPWPGVISRFGGCREGCDARRSERRVASHTSEEQRRSAPALRSPKREITPGHGLSLPLRNSRLHSRGADGRTIEQIELRWSGNKGFAHAVVVDDFAPVKVAVQAMLEANTQGHFDGFSALPFRRVRLMAALFERLGMPATPWCCLNTAGMPPARVDLVATEVVSAAAAKSDTLPPAFFPYCASCHATADRTPPNFLSGDVAKVRRQVTQCAQRLYVRLASWQLAAQDRPKTPMPPATALLRMHIPERSWRDSAELDRLTAYVRDALQNETGRAPELGSLLAKGYESLRPCLPATTGP